MSEIIIYKPAEGGQVTVRLEGESLWLTQEQMAELFGRERSVITKHLRNVFREEELEESSVCANFARTAGDGKQAWISAAQSGNCVIRCGASQIQIGGALGLMVAIVMGYGCPGRRCACPGYGLGSIRMRRPGQRGLAWLSGLINALLLTDLRTADSVSLQTVNSPLASGW